MKNILYYILIFVFCALASYSDLRLDPDIWSRLIMGHNIYTTGDVMMHDIVSYIPTHIWYDHEWLLSYLVYIFVKFFSIYGLYFLDVILCFTSILFVDFAISERNKKITHKAKSLYILFYMLLLAYVAFFGTFRCQKISFVFLPLIIYLVEKYRNNPNSNLVYMIPLIMLVWLNCHGGSMYGVGVIGLYIIGLIIAKKPVKKLVYILPITFAVYLINPWGIDFIHFMIKSISVDRTYIAEWQSPFSMDIIHIITYVLIQTVFIGVFICNFAIKKNNIQNIDYPKLFIFAASCIMSFRYIKHSYFYFIICAIFLYEDFANIAIYLYKHFLNKFKINFSIYYVVIAIYIISLSSILYIHKDNDYFKGINSLMPLKAMQFLSDNNIKGKIFAPYYISGFIAYKFYPDYKIYIDGRQEQVYNYEDFKNSMDFLFYTKEDAYSFLEKYTPDIIIIEKAWMANNFLLNYQNYFKLVYEDEVYFVYLAPSVKKFSYNTVNSLTLFSKENIFNSRSFN